LANKEASMFANSGMLFGSVFVSTAAKVTAMVLVVGACVTWWALRPSAPASSPNAPLVAQDPATSSAPEEKAQTERAQKSPELTTQDKSTERHLVRGQVVDHLGRPVHQATVMFSEQGFEEERERREGDREMDSMTRVVTDEKGLFQVKFDTAKRLFARVHHRTPDAFLEVRPQWIETPAQDVEFRVELIPTATVMVRATSLVSGEELSGFTCLFRRTSDGRTRDGAAEGATLEKQLPLPVNESWGEYEITLTDPRVSAHPVFVHLNRGELEEIEFRFQWGEEFSGQVVDSDGEPLQDAVVFFGHRFQMRRGHPYRAYSEENVPSNGVVTDAMGRFTIQGSGKLLSAWHQEQSPITVQRIAAARMELAPRSNILGRIFGAEGEPVAGVRVTLDRGYRTETDAKGAFQFTGLEGGVHGLNFPPERFVVLNVKPGKTANFDVHPGIPVVQVKLQQHGKPYLEGIGGLIIGMDDLASIFEFETGSGSFKLRRVLPGRYLLLNRRGILALGDFQSESAVMDIGDADLTIQAPPGTQVYLVPEGANEAVEHYSERIMRRSVPEHGKLRYEPLPRGSYELGIVGQGLRKRVRVQGPGTTVTVN
ncbi:MAG: carboxypeptidase-like regulatory domain-containing protein, partial [Planctomycetota bacterium]